MVAVEVDCRWCAAHVRNHELCESHESKAGGHVRFVVLQMQFDSHDELDRIDANFGVRGGFRYNSPHEN
jgi:hypothetical protein